MNKQLKIYEVQVRRDSFTCYLVEATNKEEAEHAVQVIPQHPGTAIIEPHVVVTEVTLMVDPQREGIDITYAQIVEHREAHQE